MFKKVVLCLSQRYSVTCIALTLCCSLLCNSGSAALLEDGFKNPPQSALPQVWWHWINGNVSKEGITKDLEAMKAAGLGGALVFDVGPQMDVPEGPVKTLSPEWYEMITFAAQEADRLGLEFGNHNCPGWSSTGGPWIKPEEAQKEFVTSERTVVGGQRVALDLPQPSTKLGFYRDVALIAFPKPGNDASEKTIPEVSIVNGAIDNPWHLFDCDLNSGAAISLNEEGSVEINLTYEKPFTARSLDIRTRTGSGGVLNVSEDGKNWRKVTDFSFPSIVKHYPSYASVSFDAVTSRYFKISLSGSSGGRIEELALLSGFRLPEWRLKTGSIRYKKRCARSTFDLRDVPSSDCIVPESVINLTGKTEWNAPAGEWTVLRVGYSLTGAVNVPASPSGTGLECDKLSKAGAEAGFNGMQAELIRRFGTLVGKSYKYVVIDSFEAGQQTWTDEFPQEFKARRGYSVVSYLPALTGRYVGRSEMTERFLWDFRRTIGDLFAENYYGHMQTLCNRHGLKLMVEPYNMGVRNNAEVGELVDIPMFEFWQGGYYRRYKLNPYKQKLVSSGAHISGNNIVAAESLSARPQPYNWSFYPGISRGNSHFSFTQGLNRHVFHRFTHQPWGDRYLPGMTMGQWGSHIDRTQTWWNLGAKPWFSYLSRSQYLLQQGQAVADICFLLSEGAPARAEGDYFWNKNYPVIPLKGYDYDLCSANAVMDMQVENGELVLPSGMHYRVLVLPKTKWMTPQLVKKVSQLAEQGAVIVAEKPKASPSLSGYPECDAQVIALWSDKIRSTLNFDQTIGPQDVDIRMQKEDGICEFIHRRKDNADIYFIFNYGKRYETVLATFRVRGKQPERWDPETGAVTALDVFQCLENGTQLPIRLGPEDGTFIVFRGPLEFTPELSADVRVLFDAEQYPCRIRDWREPKETKVAAADLETDRWPTLLTREGRLEKWMPALSLDSEWSVDFPFGSFEFLKLTDWKDHRDKRINYFSGTAVYRKTFDFTRRPLSDTRYYLDLGAVAVMAKVELNGQDLGVQWFDPYRVEITDALIDGNNELKVTVVNQWQNRLVGDEQLPSDIQWKTWNGALQKFPDWVLNNTPRPVPERETFTTWRYVDKSAPLLPSGLIGPVRIIEAKSQPEIKKIFLTASNSDWEN